MSRTARRPRMAKHHDTTFCPIMTGVGNDDWQRQADAAAWSAVSGMAPALYLGGIEPIPVPPALRAQLREAGKTMADLPSPERLDRLMRLAHRAAYGVDDATPTLEASAAPAGGVSGGDWWDTPASDRSASEAALNRLAEEAHDALAASVWTPEDGGEVPRGEAEKEWWE